MNHITTILVIFSTYSPTVTMHCPPSVRIHLAQNEAAARPAGVVQFIADVQGVSIDEIMYYRWSIREFNYPLYTFSKSLNISQISYLHDDMIVHENHNFSNGGIVSQINVSVDTTRYYKYVFLLHTMNDKICKRNVKPKFKDPKINIDVSANQILCCVSGAVGTPSFAFRLETESGDKRELSTYSVAGYTNRFCVYTERVNVTDHCRLICQIADQFGHYKARKSYLTPAIPPIINATSKMPQVRNFMSSATKGLLFSNQYDIWIIITMDLYLSFGCSLPAD